MFSLDSNTGKDLRIFNLIFHLACIGANSAAAASGRDDRPLRSSRGRRWHDLKEVRTRFQFLASRLPLCRRQDSWPAGRIEHPQRRDRKAQGGAGEHQGEDPHRHQQAAPDGTLDRPAPARAPRPWVQPAQPPLVEQQRRHQHIRVENGQQWSRPHACSTTAFGRGINSLLTPGTQLTLSMTA